MHRRENGEIFDGDGVQVAGDYRTTQSGWYLQSVYQFATRWRAGAAVRLAGCAGTPSYVVRARSIRSLDASPDRVSLMLDWSPSEFSRLRAQYDWDNARDDGDTDRILRLQYVYGLGAHGAHKY